MSYIEFADGVIWLDDGTVLPPLDEDEGESWATDPGEVERDG